uniref:Mediator of RNA polymerase II transcription subunit 26 n=1 Tax=Salarias fasciatus TaxID=181472 RepID=A0A672JUH5_SALFA
IGAEISIVIRIVTRLLAAFRTRQQICNMVVVMEVVSFLEKYPITKEALEETRLGKIINDLRKKTKNEDLAKRAKKLLRKWQKLIEPVKGGMCSPKGILKKGPELKSRNDFNNCSPRVEKPNSRKSKGDQTGQLIPAKISKPTLNDKMQNASLRIASGLGAGSEVFADTRAHPLLNRDISEPLDKEISEPLDSERLSKIPINPVKPHPSGLGSSKPPRSSPFLKTSVLQQQARQEQAVSGTRYRPRSPRFTLHSPQTSKPEGFHTDRSRPADLDSQNRLSSAPLQISAASASSDTISFEDEGRASNTGKRKRQKSKDHVVNLDGQTLDDCTKPVRLKDRRLPFDPLTGKIETSFHKDSFQEGEVRVAHRSELQWSEQLKKSSPVPPSPFQQTDWKELSRSEIIQSYLSQQSSVLTSSGAHTTGAHFFMTEFLKKEEHRKKDMKKTHVDITTDDLSRLHTQHWPGVNGCYDTKGTWYDWTECISLDPHGDESRLNILPYVCLD